MIFQFVTVVLPAGDKTTQGIFLVFLRLRVYIRVIDIRMSMTDGKERHEHHELICTAPE